MEIKPKQKTKFSIIKSPTKKSQRQKSIININKNTQKRASLIKLIEEDMKTYRQSNVLFNTESQNEITKKYKVKIQMEDQFFYNTSLSTRHEDPSSQSILLSSTKSTKSNSNSLIYNNTVGPFGEGSFSLKRLNSKEERHKSSLNSENSMSLNNLSSKKGSYKQQESKYTQRKSETLAYLISEYNHESKIRNEVIKNITLMKMNVSNRKLNKEKTIRVSCNNIIKNILDREQYYQWNDYIQNQIKITSRKNVKYGTALTMTKNKKLKEGNQRESNHQYINMRDKGVFFNLIHTARKNKVADFLKIVYFSKEDLFEKTVQKQFNYLYSVSEKVKASRKSKIQRNLLLDQEYNQVQSVLPLPLPLPLPLSPIKEHSNETENLINNTKNTKLFNKKASFPEEILSFLNFKEIKYEETDETNSAKLVFENKISNEEGNFKYDDPSEIKNVLRKISNEGSLIESRRLLMMFDHNRINLEIDIKRIDEKEEKEEDESKTCSKGESSIVTEGCL